MNRPFIAGLLAGSLPRLRDPLDPEAAVARRGSRLRGDHIAMRRSSCRWSTIRTASGSC